MAPNDEAPAAEAPPAEEAAPPAEGDAPPPAAAEETAPVTDDAAPPPEIKAFIGGLAWEVNDDGLADEFRKYNIISAHVACDRMSGRSR